MKFRLIVKQTTYEHELPERIAIDSFIDFKFGIIGDIKTIQENEIVLNKVFNSDRNIIKGDYVFGHKIDKVEVLRNIINIYANVVVNKYPDKSEYFSNMIKNNIEKHNPFYKFEYLNCINKLDYKSLYFLVRRRIMSEIDWCFEYHMQLHAHCKSSILDYYLVKYIEENNLKEDIFYLARKYNITFYEMMNGFIHDNYYDKPLCKYFRKRFGGI
ncbi:MAG: hypothetical protein ACRCXT_23795 [Paraclostridium sp.]